MSSSTTAEGTDRMGAKTWMLVYADTNAREALSARPPLLREASHALACTLFAGERLEPLDDGDLSRTSPPHRELLVGCFPGVSVVAAREFGLDFPSRLAPHFIAAAGNGTLTLHAMHSVVDWFAFATWSEGHLVRALSLSAEQGVIENIGTPLPFERPFWAATPASPDSAADSDVASFRFHPLDLGEAALRAQFGYLLEGTGDATLLAPETVPLLRYRRIRKRWWAFWR